MNNFHRAVLLYFGDYPGQRSAKLLGFSKNTISKWKLSTKDPKPFVFNKLKANLPKRQREIDATAAKLIAKIEAWKVRRSQKLIASQLSFEAALNRASPTEKEAEEKQLALRQQPALNPLKAEDIRQKRAIVRKLSLSSKNLSGQKDARKAEDTNLLPALLRKAGTSAYTPQSSEKVVPPISQNPGSQTAFSHQALETPAKDLLEPSSLLSQASGRKPSHRRYQRAGQK